MARTYKVIDADGHILEPFVAGRTKLSEKTRSEILGGGAMRFYGLA